MERKHILTRANRKKFVLTNLVVSFSLFAFPLALCSLVVSPFSFLSLLPCPSWSSLCLLFNSFVSLPVRLLLFDPMEQQFLIRTIASTPTHVTSPARHQTSVELQVNTCSMLNADDYERLSTIFLRHKSDTIDP